MPGGNINQKINPAAVIFTQKHPLTPANEDSTAFLTAKVRI
jgi:hypothetical protein